MDLRGNKRDTFESKKAYSTQEQAKLVSDIEEKIKSLRDNRASLDENKKEISKLQQKREKLIAKLNPNSAFLADATLTRKEKLKELKKHPEFVYYSQKDAQDMDGTYLALLKDRRYFIANKMGGSNYLDTSLGNLMLEQAYAKSKYASLNKIKGDVSNINIDKAMKFIYGGHESNVFNELTGSNNAIEYVNKSYKNAEHDLRHPKYISNEKMSELLDQYADSDKYILCAGSGVRESGSLPDYGVSSNHAYAIEKIDKENKTVTVINPYNSLFVSEISYEQFMKFFASLSVMKVG